MRRKRNLDQGSSESFCLCLVTYAYGWMWENDVVKLPVYVDRGRSGSK